MEKKGKFSIISKPRVIGEKEEENLKDMLNELDECNESDSDSDDEDMGSGIEEQMNVWFLKVFYF